MLVVLVVACVRTTSWRSREPAAVACMDTCLDGRHDDVEACVRRCPAVEESRDACPMPHREWMASSAKHELRCHQIREPTRGTRIAGEVAAVVGGALIVVVLFGALFYNDSEGGACWWPPCDD